MLIRVQVPEWALARLAGEASRQGKNIVELLKPYVGEALVGVHYLPGGQASEVVLSAHVSGLGQKILQAMRAYGIAPSPGVVSYTGIFADTAKGVIEDAANIVSAPYEGAGALNRLGPTAKALLGLAAVYFLLGRSR